MSLGLLAVIGLVFVALFTREVIAPASKASCDRRWLRIAGAVNVAQACAALLVGFVFEEFIKAKAIWPVSSLTPPVAGATVFLAASFVAYWWHRLEHASPTAWRLVHQLHHSPTRVETLTAFYAHPLDSAFASTITCSIAYLVFGFDAFAVAWSLFYVSAFNLYIHSDTSSPRWVGYIVQRPEMHRVHHQLDHHAQNYGLPIWDLLFGTWSNPESYVERCGFEGNREGLVHEMLLGHDVNAEHAVKGGASDV